MNRNLKCLPIINNKVIQSEKILKTFDDFWDIDRSLVTRKIFRGINCNTMNSILIPNLSSRTWLMITFIGLSFVCRTAARNRSNELCTTNDCLRSASMLIDSINTSISPCDNFYQFACGNFGKMNRIPNSSFSTDQFSQVDSAWKDFIRDYLEKGDSETDPVSVTKARALYRSCMDLDAIDAAGLQPLIDILNAIGLPILGIDTIIPPINLSKILANIKKIINHDILFSTTVESDVKNHKSSRRITLFKPNDLHVFPAHEMTSEFRKISSRKVRETSFDQTFCKGQTKDSGSYDDMIKYFRNVMIELIDTSGIDYALPKDPKYKTTIQTILACSEEYSQLKNNVYDTDQNLPLLMTVNDLQTFTDNITQNAMKTNERIIDWNQYLTILFADVENVTLNFKTDLIQVYHVDYFKSLFKTLDNVHVTYNIMHLWWEVVTYVLPYTTNRMRLLQDSYYYETTGLKNNPSRSLHCANSVNSMMGLAVAYSLVGDKSVDHNRHMLIEMMENIRWAFEKQVTELNWMDDQTKNKTIYKAKQMKTLVAFPDFLKDPKQLDEYYENFEVINENYLGSVLLYAQRQLNSTLLALRQQVFKFPTWSSNPFDANAFNWIQENTIIIPAGILQFPFFGHDLQILNYGSLGMILGHELTHGFDNTGRQFDIDGNERMWWTNRTIDEYEKRTDCFVRHYESYTFPGINVKVNGKSTLDENIADNGGLREALWAYRKFVTDHGEEPKLPGLEQFSNEQLYFLSFANSWCQVFKEGLVSEDILSDEHCPNNIRVVAALINSDEFSQIWKCEKGTKMNPQGNKCKIW